MRTAFKNGVPKVWKGVVKSETDELDKMATEVGTLMTLVNIMQIAAEADNNEAKRFRATVHLLSFDILELLDLVSEGIVNLRKMQEGE